MRWMTLQAISARPQHPGNSKRPEKPQDWRFHTRGVRDAVLHPTAALNDPMHAPAPVEAVLFGELLETSRTFLCSTTRCGHFLSRMDFYDVASDSDSTSFGRHSSPTYVTTY